MQPHMGRKSQRRPRDSHGSHPQPSLPRKVDSVIFSNYEIRTLFPSPYPLEELPLFTPKQPPSGDARKRLKLENEETKEQVAKEWSRLWVCEGCFKYTLKEAGMSAHQKACSFKSPPGRKVYQRGAHTIWELDGSVAKLYCQNLCLFGKLFIEHKYMFFDTDGFLFYVLTDGTPSFDFVLGYFSKEKVSYDGNNLACIITFPPYQKRGFGSLLIEFSYELTRRSPTSTSPGSPERPLSLLGERGYLSYWTGVLVRYFRTLFESESIPGLITIFGVSGKIDSPKKRKNMRGWAGEIINPADEQIEKDREERYGIIAPHVPQGTGDNFELESSLKEIALHTNIRVDDVIYALVYSGLAQYRLKQSSPDELDEYESIVITRELVEQVATRMKIKKGTMMDLNHVLI